MVQKITIANQFDTVVEFMVENGAPQELVDFVTERKELHLKRNASRGKVNEKKLAENTRLCEMIAETLAGSTGMTCSEIVASRTDWGTDKPMSTSKMTSLLKSMDNITRVVEKGKPYFSLSE